MEDVPKILVDLERMRYPNTGLYHYCLHLGNALQQQEHLHKARLGFYLRKETLPLFEQSPLNYIQHSLDKHHMLFAAKFNIWHCTFQGSNYFPKSSKTKIVLTIHDLNFLYEELPHSRQKKFLHSLQRKINRADVVIAISEFVKKDMLHNLQATGKQVKVIYNGCNINDALAPSVPAIVPSAPFIFTIGAINEKKNLHVLPGMLLHNDYFLVIAGTAHDENYKKKILDAAKNLDVDKRIIFTGAILESEKYWYLRNCLVFAFPSLAEGFGLPVIEAMHFGKPVILSKATSLPEIGGEYAYYFDEFDPFSMQNTLEETLSDYTSRNNAAKIIEWSQNFDWQTTAEKHWQVYESLL
jgi:glycosyltransferase involved in cell wall biosynthesis